MSPEEHEAGSHTMCTIRKQYIKGGRMWPKEHEVVSHTMCSQEAGARLPFLPVMRCQAMSWCHSYSGWVSFPQLNLSGNIPRGNTQRCVSVVILDPAKNNNYQSQLPHFTDENTGSHCG